MQNLDLTKKYVLAVSGGIDSMVMLHNFACLCPRPDFSVVTVDHGIRKEAASDCEFVKDYCKKLNVECKVFRVDAPSYARLNKLSLETAARILRYGVFDGIECDSVCLAHHKGDNAETVLMHILRGSGAYGAQGIKRQNGKYLRPLLDMSREDIENYAKEHNVPNVVDSTNEETKYTRNRIRHEVIPVLKSINPNAENNLVRFASNIAEDNEYLENLADVSDVEFGQGYAKIPVGSLLRPKPIAYRILRKTFEKLGVFKDVEKTHVEAIIKTASGQGGKSVYLPFGFIAVNDYGFVTIEQISDGERYEFEIRFKTGETVTPIGTVEVSKTRSSNSLQIDLNSIPPSSLIRTRKQGDFIYKFGGGRKTLKKYLIDKKIPRRQRDGLLLIADGAEALVICGVEISDKVKTDETSDIYYVSIKEE